MTYNKGKGKSIKWIMAHLGWQHDDCLLWPFSRDGYVGRGRLGWNGKMYWAHRLMCILAHGKAPPEKPQVRHSCGNGHAGCVNPRHLSWANQSENHLDRREHGTAATGIGQRSKLTVAQIMEIKAMRGKETQLATAKRFGISHANVRYWQYGRDRMRSTPYKTADRA